MPSPTTTQYKALYLTETDFTQLSLKDGDFAALLEKNLGYFEFHRPDHVKQLTKTLLKLDFDLELELPDDRLCPPVPVRYHYVRWIQELLDTTGRSFEEEYDPERAVTGLDIGVGSSNIYSLLALRMRPAWRMCGIEIDDTNFSYAKRNTEHNSLTSRMRLLKIQANDSLFALEKLGVDQLDFTMCNPPFFSDLKEMQASLSGESKSTAPSAVCTGAEVEMVTQGGDEGFVLRMVDESVKLKNKVQWFSSMLGKFKSLEAVAEKLRVMKVDNTAVCALRAGNKTTRWAIAWSFQDLRPRNDVARRDMVVHSLLPFPTEYLIPMEGRAINVVASTIDRYMNDLDLKWAWSPNNITGTGLALGNVWSRAARREKQRKAASQNDELAAQDNQPFEGFAIGFKISVAAEEVVVRWTKGTDRVLWESLRGMLHRLVRDS